MRFSVILAVLSGCSSNGTGTVVYSEANTGHIMTVDVASGATNPVDLGFFGNVSIAPDGQHVAYMGEDNLPKVADLLGHVTELAPTNGCGAGLIWRPNSTLSYCVLDTTTGSESIAFLPGIGSTIRKLQTTSIAVSSDGTRIAYLLIANPTMSSQGDLVVEDANGANRQVLAPSIQIDRVAFLPDDRGLVVSDILESNQFIQHIATVPLSGGGLTDLGAGLLVDPLPNGSRFSPDGREVLVNTGAALVAMVLASGEQRTFAMVGAGASIEGAAFLASDRIVYERQDSSFMGDVGSSSSSVRFADGTDRVTLVSSDGSSQCLVASVAASAGQVALVCSVPAIVSFDGTLITSRNAQSTLGISADHDGMVTIDNLGKIEYVSDSGGVRELATANTSSTVPTLASPYAAYAP